jgi:hypothetical protein
MLNQPVKQLNCHSPLQKKRGKVQRGHTVADLLSSAICASERPSALPLRISTMEKKLREGVLDR